MHISISILSQKELVSDVQNIRYAESLLIHFVNSFQNIYGEQSVTYNVHNLIHLAKDVENYGPLESFSAFPFKNYICSLKKFVRKGEKPLEQIARRLAEHEYIVDIKNNCIKMENMISVDKVHYNGTVTNSRQFDCQYKMLSINSWSINVSDRRNNCIMLSDGTIINVLNIAKSNNILYLIGKRCLKKKNLFSLEDFYSGSLNINVVEECNVIEDWPCNLIRAKIFKIPCETGFITYPLNHTFVLRP